MTSFVDLHLHSTCSDGVHAPAAVVRMAAGAGLAAIALCDHDNIDGIDEAMTAGRATGVEVIAGIELSAVHGEIEDLHLLGYAFDHHDPDLRRALAEFQAFRAGRNERIVERINRKLVREGRSPIDFGDVLAKAAGTLGRPHIAMALMQRGYAASAEEAFQRYLIECNVPKRFFPVGEAIDLIHRAGGITSLAHPPFITRDRELFRRLLADLIPLGLDGIEAYNSGATNDDIDWYLTQARRGGLIVTGGSDFHGIEGEELVLGGLRGNLKIPYACLEEIRSVRERRFGNA